MCACNVLFYDIVREPATCTYNMGLVRTALNTLGLMIPDEPIVAASKLIQKVAKAIESETMAQRHAVDGLNPSPWESNGAVALPLPQRGKVTALLLAIRKAEIITSVQWIAQMSNILRFANSFLQQRSIQLLPATAFLQHILLAPTSSHLPQWGRGYQAGTRPGFRSI